MKSKVFLVTVCVFFALLVSASVYAQNKKEKKSNKATVTFFVEDMECKNCQATVEKNIAFEKGVTAISCDLPNRLVTITYRTDKTSPEKIAKGFDKIKMPAVIAPAADSLQSQQ